MKNAEYIGDTALLSCHLTDQTLLGPGAAQQKAELGSSSSSAAEECGLCHEDSALQL